MPRFVGNIDSWKYRMESLELAAALRRQTLYPAKLRAHRLILKDLPFFLQQGSLSRCYVYPVHFCLPRR
jgi:hypothetical protein